MWTDVPGDWALLSAVALCRAGSLSLDGIRPTVEWHLENESRRSAAFANTNPAP
jgi:hypothetical protein